MLSDTLFEIVANLKADVVHYTTGPYTSTYDSQVIERIDKVIEELIDIFILLDNPNSSKKP